MRTTRDDGGWKRTAWRYVFECPWFRVRQDDVTLPQGSEIQYHVIERSPFAMVVPLLDDGRVVMERVYRWTLGRWVLECPSGSLDGDSPEDGARRELEEETGYRAGCLEPLGEFASADGYSDETFHVFLATELSADGTLAREETEQIELELIPLETLRQASLRGELLDAPTALAVLLAAARRPPA